jgi:hypothetical protein
MTKMEKADTPMPGGRIAALQEAIRHSFPARIFEGQVTPVDGAWISELDDEPALYKALKGRRWTEIPRQLIYDQPDGFELLTDQAFVTFLPAWLFCSLENIDDENEVRNFIVYAFSPRETNVSNVRDFQINRVKMLSTQQRLTLRSLLAEFAERGTAPFVKALAARDVAFIDSLK